jgi:hypothetical protein
MKTIIKAVKGLTTLTLAGLMGVVVGSVAPTQAAVITTADATGLNLNTAGNYLLLDFGGTYSQNGLGSAGIQGNVGLAGTTKANVSGPQTDTITGAVDYGSSVTGLNTFSQATVNGGLVPTSNLNGTTRTTYSDALAVANFAASLSPDVTYTSTLSSPTTFTAGSGGLNVIDIGTSANQAGIQNAPLTFSGGANDYFVVNVYGDVSLNTSMTLSGGVTANHILFNILSSDNNNFQTSNPSTKIYGTILDLGNVALGDKNQASIQADAATFNGELISFNNLTFNSNAQGTQDPFSVGTVEAPEPIDILGSCLLLVSLPLVRREYTKYQRKSKN